MKNPLDKKPFIIADVGSNHRGDLQKAIHHIDTAAACGVDAVKFQLFNCEELYGIPGKVEFELPPKWIPILENRARERKIEFMCTAFSPEGVEFIDKFVNVHKVASAEMCYLPLLDAVLKTNKPFIVSTGGAQSSEVFQLREYLNLEGYACDRVKILECVAAYPAKIKDYALLSGKWDGVSDHTLGTTLALTAVGAGATIFEKHFDALRINKPLKDSPDSPFSMGPRGLANYCKRIRAAFTCLGDHKTARASEQPMTITWRRRLKITKPVKGGQDILKYGENFGIFRSLKTDTRAAAAWDYKKFEGARVKRDMSPQEGLWFDDIE